MAQNALRISQALAGVVAAALAAGAIAALSLPAPAAATAVTTRAYALSGGSLLAFDPAKPSTVTMTSITGLAPGETLVGIDIRPQNGMLYALGINASIDKGTLYGIGTESGVAAQISAAGSVAMTSDGVTPIELPDPTTVGYGFDFIPTADRLRVVAGSLNFRINPNTGLVVDSDGLMSGTQPDGAINGGTTTVDAAAYTNSRPNQTVTTLYTLDAATNRLYLQNPAVNGTQTQGSLLTLGGQTLDFTTATGFDIDDSVEVADNNQPVTSGSAVAILSVGGVASLYRIDLTNGHATVVGTVGTGAQAVQGLALQRNSATAGRPVVGLDAAGAQLKRFATTSPGTITGVPVALLSNSETLVAIAWRPTTGQLFGLGINAATDAGSLYLMDPQTGGATLIGSAGQVAFVDGVPATIDLPAPNSTGYGMDFNPIVDRIRVVTGNGLNFRVNPTTGAPIDGNAGVAGVQPDADLNGLDVGSTGMAAVSYSNAYPHTGSDTVTTEYAIDPAANQLAIINPPNAGLVTTKKQLTLGGSPVDVSGLLGFDMTREVVATAAGQPASGTAYAALVVNSLPGLYLLDVATAKVTSLGTIGGPTTLRSIAVGEAQDPPPPVPATLVKAAAPKQLKRARVDTGQILVCPSDFTGTTCPTSVKVIVASGKGKGKVLGTASFAVAKGGQLRMVVKLSKKGVKLIKKRSKLPALIAITYPGGPSATSATLTLKLKLKASKL